MFSRLSDEKILLELGRRFEAWRLASRIPDRDLYAQGGVKKDALVAFKKGRTVTLLNFIKILRGAKLLDGLEQLFPSQEQESPMALVSRRAIKPPKRIRNVKMGGSAPFEWGEP